MAGGMPYWSEYQLSTLLTRLDGHFLNGLSNGSQVRVRVEHYCSCTGRVMPEWPRYMYVNVNVMNTS
jgi:hypothetical protein